MQFDSSIKSGLDEIDEQHKFMEKIVYEINHLDVVEGNLIGLLIMYQIYLRYHFLTEKKYMELYLYPQKPYGEHLKAHDNFLIMFKKLIDVTTKSASRELLLSVVKTFNDELYKHQKNHDIKLIEFLKNKVSI